MKLRTRNLTDVSNIQKICGDSAKEELAKQKNKTVDKYIKDIVKTRNRILSKRAKLIGRMVDAAKDEDKSSVVEQLAGLETKISLPIYVSNFLKYYENNNIGEQQYDDSRGIVYFPDFKDFAKAFGNVNPSSFFKKGHFREDIESKSLGMIGYKVKSGDDKNHGIYLNINTIKNYFEKNNAVKESLRNIQKSREDVLNNANEKELGKDFKTLYKNIMELRKVLTGQEMVYEIAGSQTKKGYVVRLNEEQFLEILDTGKILDRASKNTLLNKGSATFEGLKLGFNFNFKESKSGAKVLYDRNNEEENNLFKKIFEKTSTAEALEIISANIDIDGNFTTEDINLAMIRYENSKKMNRVSIEGKKGKAMSLGFSQGGDAARKTENGTYQLVQDKAEGGVLNLDTILKTANVIINAFSSNGVNEKALLQAFTGQLTVVSEGIYDKALVAADRQAIEEIQKFVAQYK